MHGIGSFENDVAVARRQRISQSLDTMTPKIPGGYHIILRGENQMLSPLRRYRVGFSLIPLKDVWSRSTMLLFLTSIPSNQVMQPT